MKRRYFKPLEQWPAEWRHTGWNGALRQAARALRFLADNERPSGGEQFPNTDCCRMIADDLETTEAALEQALPRLAAVNNPVQSSGVATESTGMKITYDAATKRFEFWVDANAGQGSCGENRTDWQRAGVSDGMHFVTELEKLVRRDYNSNLYL